MCDFTIASDRSIDRTIRFNRFVYSIWKKKRLRTFNSNFFWYGIFRIFCLWWNWREHWTHFNQNKRINFHGDKILCITGKETKTIFNYMRFLFQFNKILIFNFFKCIIKICALNFHSFRCNWCIYTNEFLF